MAVPCSWMAAISSSAAARTASAPRSFLMDLRSAENRDAAWLASLPDIWVRTLASNPEDL